jgi:hypothetical protein
LSLQTSTEESAMAPRKPAATTKPAPAVNIGIEAGARARIADGLSRFLAAGLLWGLWLAPDDHGVRAFFLGCVVVAGVFGAATVNRRVFFVQALPALLGLVLLLLR